MSDSSLFDTQNDSSVGEPTNAESTFHPKSGPTHPELKGTMSTQERKRFLREQRWNAKQEARKERRKEEKQRRAEKRKNAQEDGQPKLTKTKREESVQVTDSGVTIVLDMGFDEYMNEKEIRSTAGQVVYSYSALKPSKDFYSKACEKVISTQEGDADDVARDKASAEKVEFKTAAMKLVRISPQFKEIFAKACSGHVNWQNVTFSSLPLEEEYPAQQIEKTIGADRGTIANLHAVNGVEYIAPHVPSKPPATKSSSSSSQPLTTNNNNSPSLTSNFSRCVYLTADSPNILRSLEPGTSYFLGGIVDRNRHKHLCFNQAQALGMQTARLPIEQFLELKTRHVLTINQVVAIMMAFLNNGGDWKQAFLEVIPERKGAKLKENDALSDTNTNVSQDGKDTELTGDQEHNVHPEKKRKLNDS